MDSAGISNSRRTQIAIFADICQQNSEMYFLQKIYIMDGFAMDLVYNKQETIGSPVKTAIPIPCSKTNIIITIGIKIFGHTGTLEPVFPIHAHTKPTFQLHCLIHFLMSTYQHSIPTTIISNIPIPCTKTNIIRTFGIMIFGHTGTLEPVFPILAHTKPTFQLHCLIHFLTSTYQNPIPTTIISNIPTPCMQQNH